jgi:peptidoglycan/xylan/chitin deacetylase (PgdA/CDA1 family)
LRRASREIKRTALACGAAVCVLLLAGCRTPEAIHGALLAPARAAVAPFRSLPDYRRIKPNEVGRIPILMYHSLGDRIYPYDRHGLNIHPATFHRQLQLMYKAGWYPVNLRDVLTARMEVPAGRIPVVLTFDDARGSQFRYLKDGTLDPNCAVGIMVAFHAKHPDWPLRATFYVLPESRWNPAPFWQPGRAAKKLQWLAQQGFEIANHSTSHRRMDRMDARTLRWEMAECVRYVKARAPRATMDTMALPMGYVPRTDALLECLLRGTDGGTAYANRCIVRAWGGPVYSPVDRRFDCREITRIGSEPGYIEGWIRRLRPGSSFAPYVSDGDPGTVTVPKRLAKRVDTRRLDGARLVAYDDRRRPKEQRQAGKPVKRKKTVAGK